MITLSSTAAAPRPVLGKPYKTGFWASLMHLRALYRSRRQLAGLSPEQLRDVGLSAEMAKKEAERPVWDVPTHWLE